MLCRSFLMFLAIFVYGECDPCPSGWILFENECYLITGNSSNFAGAQNFCLANGGDLVSIHDNATNYFIQSQFVPNIVRYWIGLACNESKGAGANAVCTWLDGTLYNYQDWTTGEPDGATGGAACANKSCLVTMLDSGKWDDHGDFASFGIACQRKCNPTTTPVPTTCPTSAGYYWGNCNYALNILQGSPWCFSSQDTPNLNNEQSCGHLGLGIQACCKKA
uniref:C-type lectin domain-containing protein n=1 Tax=Acrobeloides nanus TaxID=290746 RepID=A0A914CEH0_9BILA